MTVLSVGSVALVQFLHAGYAARRIEFTAGCVTDAFGPSTAKTRLRRGRYTKNGLRAAHTGGGMTITLDFWLRIKDALCWWLGIVLLAAVMKIWLDWILDDKRRR
jgi:hypothetical protein